MLKKFADFVIKNRRAVIVVWLMLAILTTTMAPKLGEVTSNDQSSFLPSSYESVKAQELANKYFASSTGESAIIVFKNNSDSKLTEAQQDKVAAVVADVNKAGVKNVETALTAPQLLSADNKVQLAQVQFSQDATENQLQQAIKDIRSNLSTGLSNSDLKSGVTGSPAIMLDIQDSASRAEKVVGIVTILLILLLPTIIFRSLFPALLSLGVIGMLYAMTQSLLALAAKTFHFTVSGQLTPLLIVVLFGIGTDYILFLLFRYREQLKTGDHTKGAIAFALTRAGEAIMSAALVVGVAFAALFAASFKMFSSLAPGLVIAVGLMLLAAMTLVPALLAVIGPKIFWPSKKWQSASTGTLATKVGRTIARRPGLIATVILVVLVALGAGITKYKASFDVINQLPNTAEATIAYKDMSKAFPAGTTSPVSIYIASDTALVQDMVTDMASKVAAVPGIASIAAPKYADDGKAAVITAILSQEPSSAEALETVAGPVTDAAHSTTLNQTASIAVGGDTASNADLKKVTNHDLKVIVPIALVIIFIILAILLRSLVAPAFILLTVGLGVIATLGLATTAFVTIGGSSGVIFLLPILVYIFVVAVATDYNILMITRLREEVHLEGNHPRLAAERAVEHSMPTLLSAGLILAGTFGSLAFAGMSLMTQLGFSIAVGIVLGAFLISLLLIPSISALLGKWVWWPGHSSVKDE